MGKRRLKQRAVYASYTEFFVLTKIRRVEEWPNKGKLAGRRKGILVRENKKKGQRIKLAGPESQLIVCERRYSLSHQRCDNNIGWANICRR